MAIYTFTNDASVSQTVCKIEGFIRNFFELSSFFWTSIITFMVYREAVRANFIELFYNKYFWLFLCYSLAFILALMYNLY